MIFKTGFEHGTTEVWDNTVQRAKDFTGVDDSTGFDWESDLEAGKKTFVMNYVDHTDGTNPEMLGSKITLDPADPANRVLYTWQNDSEWQSGGYWSRVQGELRNCRFKEFYYKVRIRLDEDIALLNDHDWWIWGMLLELKVSNDRASVRISRDAETNKLVWGTHHRIGNNNKSINSEVPIQFNQWQTIEFYVKAGDQDNGRYWLKVDGETLIEQNEQMNAEANASWESIDLCKVYGNMADVLTDSTKGNKQSLKVWYDDLEMWATEDSVAAPTSLTATTVSSSQIDLSWDDNSDNETAFRLERKKGNGNFSLINILGANTTSYSNTHLSPGTDYTYRLFASNSAFDSDYSNEATATTKSKFTLNTNTDGKGEVTVEPEHTEYEEGTSVSLEAVPNEGYLFNGWEGDVADSAKSNNPLVIIMDINKTISANFSSTTALSDFQNSTFKYYPNPLDLSKSSFLKIVLPKIGNTFDLAFFDTKGNKIFYKSFDKMKLEYNVVTIPSVIFKTKGFYYTVIQDGKMNFGSVVIVR